MNAHKFFRSFTFAFQGIKTACAQQNMKFHLMSAVIVIIAGVFTGLSLSEWAILTLVMAAVISLEMVNTAIEAVVDLATPSIHPLAKVAKDVAAGAVLVFAVASVIIGGLIFIPKWF
jgi:undecaprenol kinase